MPQLGPKFTDRGKALIHCASSTAAVASGRRRAASLTAPPGPAPLQPVTPRWRRSGVGPRRTAREIREAYYAITPGVSLPHPERRPVRWTPIGVGEVSVRACAAVASEPRAGEHRFRCACLQHPGSFVHGPFIRLGWGYDTQRRQHHQTCPGHVLSALLWS